jgi:hypothetical protein
MLDSPTSVSIKQSYKKVVENMEYMGVSPSLYLEKITSESASPELRLRLGLGTALAKT